jgi:hypothetical protein
MTNPSSSASERSILFSLLHATDCLPSGWQDSMNQWLETCHNPSSVEYLLCIDRGREHDLGVFTPMVKGSWGSSHLNKPIELACGFGQFRIVVNREEPFSPINGWNRAASQSQGQYLLLCSDHSDHPSQNWDQLIMNSSDAQGQIHSHLRNLVPLLVTRAEYQETGRILRERKDYA